MKALCPKKLFYSLIILGFVIAILFAAPFLGIKAKAVTVDGDGVYEISTPEDLLFFAKHGGERVPSRARLTANVTYSGEAISFDVGKFELDLSGFSLNYDGASPFLTLTPDTILTVVSTADGSTIQSLGTVFDNEGFLTLDGGEYVSYNYSSTESTHAIINRNTLTVRGGASVTSTQGVDSYSVFSTGALTVENAELASGSVIYGDFGIPSGVKGSDFTLLSTNGSVTLSECSVGGMYINREDGSEVKASDFTKPGEAVYRPFDYFWYSERAVFPEGKIKGSFKVLSAPIRLTDRTPDLTYEAPFAPDTVTLSVTAEAEHTLSYRWEQGESTSASLTVTKDELSVGENRFRCIISSEIFWIETEFLVTLAAVDLRGTTYASPLTHLYGTQSAITPPSLTYKEKALAEGTDYTVAYLRDGERSEDLYSAGDVLIKLLGVGEFCGELNLTYRIEPRALSLTANGKWAHSNEIPTYTQDGSLAEGDTLSVTLLEDGHSVTFSSVKVTAQDGTNVTESYQITLADGLRHIPTDSFLYDTVCHYKTCTQGCTEAIIERGEHEFSSLGVCTVCGFELPREDGDKTEENLGDNEESDGNTEENGNDPENNNGETAGNDKEAGNATEANPVKMTVIAAIFGGSVATIALIFYLYKRKI